MRDGEIRLDAAITTGLLRMVDAIREILAAVEATEGEGDGDYTALIALLESLNTRETAPAATQTAAAPAAPLGETHGSTGRTEVELERPSPEARDVAADGKPGVSDSSLRVDVGLVDKLMNLVGELVLARNQILQFTTTQTDSAFISATQRLNLVTSELQEGVMKTRMQPIGNIWSRFPRIVRDLALQCGKQVAVEMEGKSTELDKTIIEAIKDPLTHVIRNSVDHGIEPPDVRRAAGKPPEGLIRLRAFHEGGQINIEIADDGGGIDPARVRAKAIHRNLITADQAGRMSDHDSIKLIFLPGFSTAEQVTNLSGRGVGMDVVKTNIEKIGGTVDVQSTIGDGTTLHIRIPLTLAIIPALMVTSGHERFAIPQVSLLELVRLEGESARTQIEGIQHALFYRLRGKLLPLAYLNEQLGLAPGGDPDVVNIVVLKAEGRRFGLIVDAINDTEEIVVKPLGKQLKGIAAFAGATIMGDGRVALILDVMGLAKRARVVSDLRSDVDAASAVPATAIAEADLCTLLLFRVSANDRMAIPLSMVARLEEFPLTQIERSAGREVVQYRDEILPLLSLPAYFGEAVDVSQPVRRVIVLSENGHRVGLVVDQILDIVSAPMNVQRRGGRRGVLGSAVIGQKVTDLLDVRAVIDDVDPAFFDAQAVA
jgi:two-component system chemotaxis sensor kinase CheA